MAKPNKLRLLTALIFFFCFVCCKYSAARPLNVLNPSNLEAADPALDIVIRVKEKIGGGSRALASEVLDSHGRRTSEMELMNTDQSRWGTGKLGGIYGSLVMNALPKGRTPASGPSRRNNGINI